MLSADIRVKCAKDLACRVSGGFCIGIGFCSFADTVMDFSVLGEAVVSVSLAGLKIGKQNLEKLVIHNLMVLHSLSG